MLRAVLLLFLLVFCGAISGPADAKMPVPACHDDKNQGQSGCVCA